MVVQEAFGIIYKVIIFCIKSARQRGRQIIIEFHRGRVEEEETPRRVGGDIEISPCQDQQTLPPPSFFSCPPGT